MNHLPLTLVLAMGVPAGTQDSPATGGVTPSPAELCGAEVLEQLRQEHRRERDEFLQRVREAVRDPACQFRADGAPVVWEEDPTGKFLDAYLEIGRVCSPGKVGIDALNFAIAGSNLGPNRYSDSCDSAFSLVAEHYLHRPEAEKSCDYMIAERCDGTSIVARQGLAKILSGSTQPIVREAASFSLATHELLGDAKDRERGMRRMREIAKDEEHSFRKKAKSYLFDMEHLQVGMQVPDFEAVDQDGKRFRLSELRGRVVVIDFWVSWCQPCVDKLPRLRQLQVEFRDEAVVFLGVNCDGEAWAQKTLRDLEVQGRTILDGEFPGPLCALWNVQGFPSTFILDGKGVMRAREKGNSTIDRRVVVQELLAD